MLTYVYQLLFSNTLQVEWHSITPMDLLVTKCISEHSSLLMDSTLTDHSVIKLLHTTYYVNPQVVDNGMTISVKWLEKNQMDVLGISMMIVVVQYSEVVKTKDHIYGCFLRMGSLIECFNVVAAADKLTPLGFSSLMEVSSFLT